MAASRKTLRGGFFFGLQQFRQPRFGAGGGVFVDQMFGSRLIEPLHCQLKCLFGHFGIIPLSRDSAFFDHGSQGRALGTIPQTTSLVLAESLFSTGGIRHGFKFEGMRKLKIGSHLLRGIFPATNQTGSVTVHHSNCQRPPTICRIAGKNS